MAPPEAVCKPRCYAIIVALRTTVLCCERRRHVLARMLEHSDQLLGQIHLIPKRSIQIEGKRLVRQHKPWQLRVLFVQQGKWRKAMTATHT